MYSTINICEIQNKVYVHGKANDHGIKLIRQH